MLSHDTVGIFLVYPCSELSWINVNRRQVAPKTPRSLVCLQINKCILVPYFFNCTIKVFLGFIYTGVKAIFFL